jgi:hypothetical protein
LGYPEILKSGEFQVMLFLSRCICDTGMNWIPAHLLMVINSKDDVFTVFRINAFNDLKERRGNCEVV